MAFAGSVELLVGAAREYHHRWEAVALAVGGVTKDADGFPGEQLSSTP